MNALDALFGLDGMRPGVEGVSFGWARPMPLWAWLGVVAAAGLVGWWSYWRLVGARRWRVVLAGVRASVLVLVVALICGPRLERTEDRVERDWVVVLVDRSASMRIPDAGAEARTRDEQVREVLRARGLADLASRKRVVWMGFDAGAYELGEGAVPEIGEPNGRRTLLGAALGGALARVSGRPVSAVVVLSDGRSSDGVPREVLRALESERIPVFAVPLGSAEPLSDVAVAEAVGPAVAFVNDTVPVRVSLERRGEGGAVRAVVRLVDPATGTVLDERTVEPGDWDQEGRAGATLVAQKAEAGRARWRVEVAPEGADLIPGNNAAGVEVDLVDRPVRVLYFDGYPRWEYRYLKNLLLRERSVTSTSQLLARNRRYIQEGDEPLAALPRTFEEWAPYDVVILGDLSAELFTREQLEQLREHVALRGAGLLWIAGPVATPWTWAQTPLGDLLPFSVGRGEGGGVRAWDEPVTMARTRVAERLGVLELEESGWPARLSDPATGWSQLRWAQRIEPEAVKPTAEALAVGSPVTARGSPSGSEPLVLSMRYGAGRVLYVATDEIWRWRYARGEDLPERFWLPLIRVQARERLAMSGRAASIEVTPRRPLVDQPTRIEVRLVDQSLVDMQPGSTRVQIRRVWPDPEAFPWPAVVLSLPAEDRGSDRPVQPVYAAEWIPTEPGRYVVESVDPLLAGRGLSAEAEVVHPDDEMRDPRTDHALLADLAQRTGGRVLGPDEVAALADEDLLPNREVHIDVPPEVRTLWDRWPVLALFVALLCAEWIGRRLMQLA